MIRRPMLTLFVTTLALGASVARAEPGHHRACRDDVAKLCKDVKRGGGRIIACLKSHEGELSQGCKDAMAERHKK